MLQYSATTLNVPFDSDYKNVINFGTIEEKKGYFLSLLGEAPFWTSLSNFNVGDGINTQVVYDCAENFNLFEQLNVNYMIIKDSEDNFYYYFIKGVKQLSNRRFKYDISIDIFTQYFDPKYFEDTKYLIKRAHLDRFDYNLTKTKLLVSEYMYATPPVKADGEYSFQQSNNCYDMKGNAFSKNVIGWKHIFINNRRSYKTIYDADISGNNIYTCSSDNGVAEFGLIIEPVLIDKSKKWTYIHIQGSQQFSIETDGTDFERIFRYGDNNASFIYDIKILPAPAFVDSVIVDYDNNTVTYKTELTAFPSTNGVTIPALNLYKQLIEFKLDIYGYLYRVPPLSYIKSPSRRNDILCPKLYDGARRLVIGYFTNEVEINILKYFKATEWEDTEHVYLICKIPVTTIETSILISIPDDIKNKYSKNISKYYGLLANMNNSVQVSNDQYSAYIANNKNFNLQFEAQQRRDYISGGLNAVIGGLGIAASVASAGALLPVSAGMSALAGGIVGGVSIAGNLLDTVNKAEYNKQNFEMNIGNLKGAPQSINNGQPNLYLQVEDRLVPFVRYTHLFDTKEDDIKSDINLYGYEYNVLDTIYKWYNSRTFHNYIQAIVEDINAPWSLNVKEQFKSAFARGVRFWHYNGGKWNGVENYVDNNYERKFENA